jgi:hypothetical protein
MNLALRDFIEWDVLNWSQLMRFWSPIIEKLPRSKKVLAIGERNGGLAAWLALNGFDVLCTDRTGPTDESKVLHARLGVADRIKYGHLDVLQCGNIAERYDLIIAKSVIGGLKAEYSDKTTRTFEVQQAAVDNIYSLLNDGGVFLSAENMWGCRLMAAYRKRSGKNNGWRYLNSKEIDILFSRFKHRDMRSFGIFPTVFKNSFVNIISYGVNSVLQFLPHNYKYISFVAAKK